MGLVCWGMAGVCSMAGLLLGEARAGTTVLQFTASAGNTSGDTIFLDSPELNKKPKLKLIVTQVWTGAYNATPVGVFYTSGTWAAYNEDESSIPIRATFNVLVTTDSVNATPANSGADLTLVTLEAKNPNAILLMTHLFNPYPALGGMYADHNLGLYYDTDFKKWSVFNEDESSPLAATYNLFSATRKDNAFVVTTAGTNVAGYSVLINNPGTNSNPNAVLFAEALYNGTYWDHPIGVYYDSGTWTVFNEDETAMPAGLTFNVVAFSGTSP